MFFRSNIFCTFLNCSLLLRFSSHGSLQLLLPPVPPLVNNVTNNPYLDPTNPPVNPETLTGVCGVKWSEERDASGLKK